MTDRQSNFELLRILAMLLIVISHYAGHGGFPIEQEFTFNKLMLQVVKTGKISVDVFVIISGYFLITQNFKLKKLLKLMGEMWFYSVAILIFALAVGLDSVTYKNIIKSLLPFGMMNWFAYAYFVLYLIFPFLNIFYKRLDQKTYLKLLLLGFCLWFLIPTFTKVTMQFSNMVLFCYLYGIGAYFRLFCEKKDFPNIKKFIGFTFIGFLSCTLIVNILSIHYLYFAQRWLYFGAAAWGVFPFLLSVGVFLYFKSLRITYSKVISVIASTTFAVYLIHDNYLLRSYLWLDVVQQSQYYHSEFLFLHAIITTVSVFTFGCVVDLIRKTFIEKPLFKYLNPKIDNLETKLRAKLDIMLERIINKTI